MRPFGVNWKTDAVDEAAMKAWRARFKSQPRYQQMMIATILWLYRGGKDAIFGLAQPETIAFPPFVALRAIIHEITRHPRDAPTSCANF